MEMPDHTDQVSLTLSDILHLASAIFEQIKELVSGLVHLIS